MPGQNNYISLHVSTDLPLDDSPKEIVVIDGVTYECAKYIYPILNWDTNPLVAAGTIGVSVLLLPVVHMIWVGLYHLRLKIYDCTLGRRVPQVRFPIVLQIQPVLIRALFSQPLPKEPVNYERPLLMQNYSTQEVDRRL